MDLSTGGFAFYLRGIGFIAAGALFWMMYFNLKDRLQPEPRRLLILAFLLGAVSALLALFLYELLPHLGLPHGPGTETKGILFYSLLVIGPVEEGFKFLVARQIVYRWKAFDEPIDGLIYASAVAIGFASLENLLYLPVLPWTEQLARSLSSPLTHSLFAAIWGFGLTRARFGGGGRGSRRFWLWVPLVVSALLHGFYDFALIAWNATFVACGITLVLWIVLIWHARKLVER